MHIVIHFSWWNITYINFEKVCKRTHLDIASVNSAVCLQVKDNLIISAGISAGGVGPVPMFLAKTSAFLTGKTVNDETVKEACAVAQSEVTPISDVRGSVAYKRLLLEQLIKSHFIKLFPQRIQLTKS